MFEIISESNYLCFMFLIFKIRCLGSLEIFKCLKNYSTTEYLNVILITLEYSIFIKRAKFQK